jgi:hypothetical protein
MAQSTIVEEERELELQFCFTFPSYMWGLTPRIGCFKKVVNLCGMQDNQCQFVPLGKNGQGYRSYFNDRYHILHSTTRVGSTAEKELSNIGIRINCHFRDRMLM